MQHSSFQHQIKAATCHSKTDFSLIIENYSDYVTDIVEHQQYLNDRYKPNDMAFSQD